MINWLKTNTTKILPSINILGCLHNPQMVWRDNSNSDLYIVLSDIIV